MAKDGPNQRPQEVEKPFPSAGEDRLRAQIDPDTAQTRSRAYRLGFADNELLLRDELRPVRLQLEFLKPDLLQEDRGVELTVAIFGSARIPAPDEAEALLAEAEELARLNPGDRLIARQYQIARSMVQKGRYYEEARRLAQLISSTQFRPAERPEAHRVATGRADEGPGGAEGGAGKGEGAAAPTEGEVKPRPSTRAALMGAADAAPEAGQAAGPATTEARGEAPGVGGETHSGDTPSDESGPQDPDAAGDGEPGLGTGGGDGPGAGEPGGGGAMPRVFVVTGGGQGIMEAANRGANDIGAESIAHNIVLPFEQVPNRYITPDLCFNFHYFALRKMHFLMRSVALVVFPGGYGTLDELFEVLTLIQTHKIKPIPVLLFGREYWDKIVNFEALVDEGVISPTDIDIFSYVETAEEAWCLLQPLLKGAVPTCERPLHHLDQTTDPPGGGRRGQVAE